jgi:hypothetical protein
MAVTEDKINTQLAELVNNITAPETKGTWMERVIAARDLPQWSKLAEQTYVDRARTAGMSWSEIGKDLGITRQSAWERYGKSEDMDDPDETETTKTRRKPKPLIKLAIPEAEIVVGILEELGTKPGDALARAISERVSEVLAVLNGEKIEPENRTGTVTHPKPAPHPKPGPQPRPAEPASEEDKAWEESLQDPVACPLSGKRPTGEVNEKEMYECVECGRNLRVRTDGRWPRHNRLTSRTPTRVGDRDSRGHNGKS